MEAKENLIARIGDDSEIEIDLYELYLLFLQKLKYIILFALLGGLLTGVFIHYFVKPSYQATAKLYVVSASNDSVVNLSDLQIGTNLTADYKELVLSRPMLESTIKNLSLDITAGQLRSMLQVSNTSGTRILTITTTSHDPEQAMKISNEMVRLAVDWLPAIMESNEPNIVENALLPTHASAPHVKKDAVIGALAAAVLYFGICVIQMLMNDTIATSEDMEHYFGVVPLTSIPEEETIRALDHSFKGSEAKRGWKKGLFKNKKTSKRVAAK